LHQGVNGHMEFLATQYRHNKVALRMAASKMANLRLSK